MCHRIEFTLAHPLFLHINKLVFDAALLEKTLRLAGVSALFCTKNLYVHSCILSVSVFQNHLLLSQLFSTLTLTCLLSS